jgi:hypothetical protein
VFERFTERAREIVVQAILRRDGRAAGWLRAAGVDEDWVREFGTD